MLRGRRTASKSPLLTVLIPRILCVKCLKWVYKRCSGITGKLTSNVDFHLNENNLMNSFQSAYTKFNSTETTLLAVHDHIIRAIESTAQVTGLCLLDLSAAFDTIDHTILLHRLKSWFGFTDTVLSWIQSYLSSRSFTVDINGIKSPPSKLLYGVPQGSVLGPLLFILYTTPLSSIISQSYLSIINSMLMTLNFFYQFQLIPFPKTFYSCKIVLYPTFLHGWPQLFISQPC